jgi:ABC-type sugar transport system ATPase subunit
VSAAFRPEHVTIGDSGALSGTIDVIENLGHETYVFVDTADGRICLIVDREQRPRPGCGGPRDPSRARAPLRQPTGLRLA